MLSSKPFLRQLLAAGRPSSILARSFGSYHSSLATTSNTIGRSFSATVKDNSLFLPKSVPNKSNLSRQNRSYHVTTNTLLPVRRRRRRGESGGMPSEEADKDGGRPTTYEEHGPLEDLVEFEREGQKCLDKLTKSVQPMIPINDPFVVERTYDMLKISLDKATGSYEIQLELDERVIVMRSPVSGAHSYFYSTKIEEWVDVNDFHSLEGLFVRDLIRHCRGVPKI